MITLDRPSTSEGVIESFPGAEAKKRTSGPISGFSRFAMAMAAHEI